jgi:sulfonate transport system substrate-binding protein
VFSRPKTRSKPQRILRSSVVLLGGLSLALTAACGSSSSGTSPAGNTSPSSSESAAPATLSANIPSGTTLRVGDQLDGLKNLLHEGGQDTNFPYKVDYSAFIGGPPMLQAFQANALDTGFIGSTPLIFAQAAKQSLVAVAGWANPGSAYQLVAAPGKSDITGWASLKGKKVAFQQGTALEAALLTALNNVGLKLSDIQTVNVPTTQISSALQGGSADAGILIEPLTSVFLASNPNAKVVATTTALTDRSSFMIASTKALNDPGKSAALADYISRLAKSYAYLKAHPDLIIQTTYIGQYHLKPARAALVAKAVGVPSFIQLPGDIAPAQQKLADLFQSNGEIPSKVDAAAEFDSRFNAIVRKAQGQ